MKYFTSYKFKEIIKIFIFIIILILLLFLSKSNFESVKTSVTLFLTSVFPSLFPFIFFTEFVLNTSVITTISKVFGNFLNKIFNVSKACTPAIIIGFLCGYPMGSKTVSSLYEKGLIDRSDANKLLLFVNNCNPAFILSTIAIGIFYNLNIGIILLLSHYLSAIIIGIIAGRVKHKNIIHEKSHILNSFERNNEKNSKDNGKKLNNFEILKKSILNSLVTLGNILGFIIIFNLIFSMLNILLLKLNMSNLTCAITSGIFEITKGCNNIYAVNMDMTLKICLISFTLGFSGLCILFQIYSTISHFKFSFKRIIGAKFVQGIISFVITYILLRYTNICNPETLTVFNTVDNISSTSDYINNMKISYLISTFIIIFGLSIYYFFFKHRNNKNK